MRGQLMLLGALLAGQGMAATLYKAQLLGSIDTANQWFNRIASYSVDGTISITGSTSWIARNGTFTDLRSIYGSQAGNPIAANSAGTLVYSSTFHSYFAPTIGAAFQETAPPPGFYEGTYFQEISESGLLYGSLTGFLGSDSHIAYIYNPVSQVYTEYFPLDHQSDSGVVHIDSQGRVYVTNAFRNILRDFQAVTVFKDGKQIDYANNMIFGGVNDHGVVVGRKSTDLSRVVLRTGGVSTELSLFGHSLSITNDGTIVGNLAFPNEEEFVWSVYKGGVRHDLRQVTTGFVGSSPIRHVVGKADGKLAVMTGSQIYELTPVPEPASLVALGIGCLALRRRR